jgi:hypothetical protein
MKVSWQVTGIRQDAYAQAHRIPVEQDKAEQDRGKYLYPTEHGQPETKLEQYELVHHKLLDVKARQAPGDAVP